MRVGRVAGSGAGAVSARTIRRTWLTDRSNTSANTAADTPDRRAAAITRLRRCRQRWPGVTGCTPCPWVRAAIGFVEAESQDAARAIAGTRWACYANQVTEAIPASRATQADIREANECDMAEAFERQS